MDDWLFRIENKLAQFGFTGDNTIAQTNFCRDEITAPLKNGIHDIFGYAMDIDGLAGFTAAGLTGLGAGMSHSPTDPNGRERYVFFAMPHIAVDSAGKPGDCIRAGRAGCSHACGALIKLQPKFEELKSGGMQIRAPGTCDHMDPEYSLLEARMLSAVQPADVPAGGLDLVQVTKLADGVIQKHMEELVRQRGPQQVRLRHRHRRADPLVRPHPRRVAPEHGVRAAHAHDHRGQRPEDGREPRRRDPRAHAPPALEARRCQGDPADAHLLPPGGGGGYY